MRKVLTEGLPAGAVGPKEREVAHFLLEGHKLPGNHLATTVLQTTFANTYVESYLRLPSQVPVIVMVRNPYSVCRSLVYNWDNLELELAHRQQASAQTSLRDEHARWEAAIYIYLDSLSANLRILTERPQHTHLVIYDELVLFFSIKLPELSRALGLALTMETIKQRANFKPSEKQHLLPRDFRELVTSRCLSAYERLIEQGRPLWISPISNLSSLSNT